MRSAVLLSGGLDSAVLLADEARNHDVYPIYVSVGLAWEPAERETLAQLLSDPTLAGHVAPLAPLTIDMRDVYAATHWAIEGRPPGYDTPDEDVYLPGRNVVLVGKAAVYCAATSIHRLVLGTLAGNPFPDATPEFFLSYAAAVNQAVNGSVQVLRPFAGMKKVDVIRRDRELPLQLTFSCIQPCRILEGFMHCGRCNKCGERRRAFHDAGVPDPTQYASETPCIV